MLYRGFAWAQLCRSSSPSCLITLHKKCSCILLSHHTTISCPTQSPIILDTCPMSAPNWTFTPGPHPQPKRSSGEFEDNLQPHQGLSHDYRAGQEERDEFYQGRIRMYEKEISLLMDDIYLLVAIVAVRTLWGHLGMQPFLQYLHYYPYFNRTMRLRHHSMATYWMDRHHC
jgi:hypothetical protein